MKSINLLLEDDEIFILRSQVRMMQILVPEEDEMLNRYTEKILQATNNSISGDWRKEIGKMQRAMRRIKETPFYPQLLNTMNLLQQKLVEEMNKEGDSPTI